MARFSRLKALRCIRGSLPGLAALGLAALGGIGCDSKQVQALAPATGAAAAPAQPSWNWEQYPAMPRMRLGTLPCQLQPKSSMTVHSPMLGTLRVYVNAPQSDLKAGFLWAEFEPDIFAAEDKAIQIAQKRLDDQEKVQVEIEIPRKKLQLERQLKEAERQLRFAQLIATNPEMSSAFLKVAGGTALRPDALENNELEFDLLARTMSFIQETNLTALGIDLGAQRLEWERRKLDYDRRRAQSRFVMPFDGKLTVNLPVSEGITEYSVNSGQEIGVIRDFSSIRVRVPIANASWSAIPGHKLSAIVRLPSGEGFDASFSYQKIERVQNREESVYYFQFPQERAEVAARLIGTYVSCELWVHLDEPAHIVPKLSLILRNPEAFEKGTWSSAIAGMFPGARVVAEGQTDLGIVVPKSVTLSQVAQ